MLKTSQIGAVVLALQLGWFVHEQLGVSRYFCWAPLHEHVWYAIDARLAGKRLSADAVLQRYGRRGAFYDRTQRAFWELNAAQHVLDTIRLREDSLPAAQRARVTLRYHIDDREAHSWTYTP
jgi:hypothetical protein